MIHPPKSQSVPVSAFCSTCPNAEEVGALLESHGFALTLTMGPSRFTQITIPPLPAQYHYRDAAGTEVIFLAGKDISEPGMKRFPRHASRWWVYPGANPEAAQHIMLVASAQWQLTWTPEQDQAVARH